MPMAKLIYSLNIKRLLLSVVMIVCMAVLAACCYCDEKEAETIKKIKIPPGMTITKVGNFYVLKAKDADVRREGTFGQIISPEGPEEFSARKMEDVEERFKKDEAEIDALKKDVAELKKVINAANKQ